MLHLLSHTGMKMNILKLRKEINSEYFDYQSLSCALAASSHIRRDIGKLLKENDIIRVKKGLYVWGEDLRRRPYSKQVLSNLIYGPSYVSLEYALSFYDLVPERVDVVTAVTPQRHKLFETPVGTFEYCHLHHGAFPWGVHWKNVEDGESFLIASPEKALLDYIAIRIQKWEGEIPCEEFLYKDLRLDEREFQKLDLSKIEKLSFYYKSKAAKSFAKEIVSMKR
jgi:predicted transcriptional regulator of viral defense system